MYLETGWPFPFGNLGCRTFANIFAVTMLGLAMESHIPDSLERCLANSQQNNHTGFQRRNQIAQAPPTVADQGAHQHEFERSAQTPGQNDIQQEPGPQPAVLNQMEQYRLRGRVAIRRPQELHLHPALARLDLVSSVLEFNDVVRLRGRNLPAQILVNENGTIIAGFRDWHEAVREGREFVDCIEYPLGDDEGLECILIHHLPRRSWNNFNRVRVALELKPYFQAKALENQSAGGKYKGSANLPKAEHIDVRAEIGAIAGVSGRTVSNVETIVGTAAPQIIDALQAGTLTINRALRWCALPRSKQVEYFTEYHTARVCDKVIRDAVVRSAIHDAYTSTESLFEALRQHEAQEPGSVVMRIGTRRETVILLGKDLLSQPPSGAELKET